MPELPEVESLRKSLLPYLVGKTIRQVEVLKPKLVSASGTKRSEDFEKVGEFRDKVTGEMVTDISRRAKHLVIHFTSGACLVVHLKMTGQLVYTSEETHLWGGHPIQTSEEQLPHKHSHIIFHLDQGTLYYNDVRMFGYVLYYPSLAQASQYHAFDSLGVEPLSQDFMRQSLVPLQGKRKTIKSALLAQDIVTGLGNIYVDEVCFRAGVRPHRLATSLSDDEVTSLYQAICEILPKAVEMGGSSVANYILSDGSKGTYAREHKVYNRGGKVCFVCGNTLEKITLQNRTTVYCPQCQT